MNTTFRSSESLPSLHSFQSRQKRLSDPRRNSAHLLAYLNHGSARSIESVSSHEVSLVDLHTDTHPTKLPDDPAAWWNSLVELKPFNLRPLSNFGIDLSPNNVPENTPKPLHFGTVPTRPHRRPPPLELDHRIVSSNKENLSPSSIRLPTSAKAPNGMAEFDPSSPWFILNQFPTPPATPSVIRGSNTSTSIHKLSRNANSMHPSLSSLVKDRPMGLVENYPSLPSIKKKRQSSFSSIGKVFKATQAPIPHTPPPIPPMWLQFDPVPTGGSDIKSPPALQRRDTFKSRLFSIGTSPKASPQDFDSDNRRPPSRPIPRSGKRVVSESAKGRVVISEYSRPIEPRSRSVSQPTQPRDKGSKMEFGIPGSSQNIPPLPNDLGDHLVIPGWRTRSHSRFNLRTPSRKHGGSSPTQASFPAENEVPPSSIASFEENFQNPEGVMRLPASGSVRSLTANLDPFGVRGLASFFRSEYEAPMSRIQVTTTFHRMVSPEAAISKKWSESQESRVVHQVPEIVISSSGGLDELKRRNWTA